MSNSWGGGPGDPFYLRDRPGVARGRHHPGLRVRQRRPGLRRGRLARRLPRGRSASARPTATTTSPTSPAAARPPTARSTRTSRRPASTSSRASRAAATRPFSGTSMAAPHVAGTLALRAVGRALAPRQLRRRDRTPSDRPPSTGSTISCGGDERRRPEQRLRRRPDRRRGRGRLARSHRRHPGGHGHRLGDADPIAGRPGHRQQRRPRRSRRSPTPTATTRCCLAAGDYTVTATRFGYFGVGHARASSIAHRPDDRPGLRPRRRCRGSPSPATSPRPRTARRSPDVAVRAIGTPVAPATTDAAGHYTLELPIGDVHAPRLGRRLHRDRRRPTITSAGDDIDPGLRAVPQARRLRSRLRARSPFDWVDATDQTALYRRRVRRPPAPAVHFDVLRRDVRRSLPLRERLPELPRRPSQATSSRSAIPSAGDAERGDLPALAGPYDHDAERRSTTQTVGDGPNRAFVIEYSRRAGPRGADPCSTSRSSSGRTARSTCCTARTRRTRVTAATRPSASRTRRHRRAPDRLLRADPRPEPAPSASRPSRPASSTAPSPTPTTACRSRAPTSPRSPAAATRRPTSDGTYTLRLRPGTYTVTATAERCTTDGHAPAIRRRRRDDDRDFSLDAPRPPSVDPTDAHRPTSTSAQTADQDRHRVATTARAARTGSAQERDQRRHPAAAAEPPTQREPRSPTWGRTAPCPRRSRASAPTDVASASLVSTIINDPIGDARARSTSARSAPAPTADSVMSMALDFSPGTPMDQAVGYVFLDTDQDPSTGVPASRSARPADAGRRGRVLPRPVRDPRSRPVVLVIDARHLRGRRGRARDVRRPDDVRSTSRSRRSAAMTGASRPPWSSATSRPDGLGAGHRPRHHPAVQRRLVAVPRPGDGRGRAGRQPGRST